MGKISDNGSINRIENKPQKAKLYAWNLKQKKKGIMIDKYNIIKYRGMIQ